MRLWLVCLVVLLCGSARADGVFVDGVRAASLVHDGALVLDARKAGVGKKHIAGAVAIDWEDFRDGRGRTGRLSDDDGKLARELGALGVLVYGDGGKGFGEEGRVAWMLRYLGHRDVHVLDGGLPAWHGATSTTSSPVNAGIFTIHRDPALRVTIDDVERAVRDHGATLVDTRTPAEWSGATPYFEARGGHLPGARFVEYAQLFDGDGKVVHAITLPRDKPVYVYCTGGVRSALATMLLRTLGYDARNFDAGLWAYSARKDLPLER